MKKIKRFASLVLALIMAMAMTLTSFAAAPTEVETKKDTGDFTITLENDQPGHTYSAYQVFKGDLMEEKDENGKVTNKVLSNIEWGTGVNQEGLIAALKAITAFEGLADNATARDVAEILAEAADDSATAQAFADVIGAHLGTPEESKSEEITKPDPADATKTITTGYKISGLHAGYYLVQDTGTVGDNDAYTRYIMQVVSDVTAEVKTEIPDIDKKIVEGDQRVEANNAGVGQVVSYEITGEVPNYTGYEKYFYVINDRLHVGLTFNNDIVVTVDGQAAPLVAGTDYHLYTAPNADGNTFQVAFDDIMSYETGKKITVTYSATVNENAVIGSSGNDNTVDLTYSNNPNSNQNGEKNPGKPDDNVPTGKSPEHKTLTYLAEIDINKVRPGDTAGTTVALPGAEFTLTGTSKQTVLTGGTYYVQNDEGKYWLLKDGTYTTDDPSTPNMDTSKYFSTTVKYSQATATATQIVETPVKMIATSGDDGKLIFKGLGAGIYTIEETVVPAGFNKADNVTIEIKVTVPTEVTVGDEKATWAVGESTTKKLKADGTESDEYIAEMTADNGAFTTGIYTATILNQSGSVLPSTGGIGTTIFYVIGGILVVAAGVLLIVRKRMNKLQ